MKVRARQRGFYGKKRVYEGDVFDITDENHFSKRWMEKVVPGQEAVKKAASPAKTSDKDKQVI
jgi:hypothetical protein